MDGAGKEGDEKKKEKMAHDEKAKKYDELAEEHGAIFVTAVFFTNGGMGTAVRNLLRQIAAEQEIEPYAVGAGRVASAAMAQNGMIALKAKRHLCPRAGRSDL